MQPIELKISLPASALPFMDELIGCAGSSGSAVAARYSVIASASCRVRRISSSLELFSSMKKCGIFVVGRNALGAQIQVLMKSLLSLLVTCVRLGPTFTRLFDITRPGSRCCASDGIDSGCTLFIVWQFTQPS